MNLSKALRPGIVRWETDVSFVVRHVRHAAKQDHLEGNCVSLRVHNIHGLLSKFYGSYFLSHGFIVIYGY